MGIKIGMVSLGCAKNRVDAELMLGVLLSDGFELETDPAKADAIIVNTCGFIEAAKQESIDTILEMAEYKQDHLKALIVTGCLLFASDRVRKGRKNEHSARMTDALIVGAAQALATCPGLSRSGTTISVGCFLGFERKFAVRYSFIMSIPAVLGANILSLKDALGGEVIWKDVPVYLLGVLVAAVVGYACIRLLKMIAAKGKFGAFAYYCWAVGLLTVILTLVGA